MVYTTLQAKPPYQLGEVLRVGPSATQEPTLKAEPSKESSSRLAVLTNF
jgi:hypothetical protein